MALDRVYYPHALKLPSPEITHISEISPTRGFQMVFESAAGAPHPCFAGVQSSDPGMAFSSRQLKSILDTCTSYRICRDLSAGDVTLWYRAGKPMDVRELEATSVHIAAQLVASSMLIWSTIRAQNAQVAEIDCNLVTAKRGILEPMAWLGSQPLPASAGCSRIYSLGPVYHNGVLLNGVTGVTVTSGIQQEKISADGTPYPTYQGVRDYHIQASIQSSNLAEIVNSSNGGDSFNTLEIYLRRMSSTNYYVDNGVAEHIKLTLNGGLRTVDGATGSPATTNPMFYTTGLTPLTVDTASAIV